MNWSFSPNSEKKEKERKGKVSYIFIVYIAFHMNEEIGNKNIVLVLMLKKENTVVGDNISIIKTAFIKVLIVNKLFFDSQVYK